MVSYKTLYESAMRKLNSASYLVVEKGFPEDPNHEHSFDEWTLASEGGIAYCDWKCSCGLTVSQFIGERVKPEALPSELTKYTEWSE